MFPFHSRRVARHAHPGPVPPARMRRVVLRVCPVAALLTWQFAVASPAQASPGDLDPSFGTDGKVTTDFAGGQDVATGLVVQGRELVAAGRAFAGATGNDFALARYRSNGTLDPSFGTGGKVTTNIGPGNSADAADALIRQADGKLVAAGFTFDPLGVFDPDFVLARYSPDGTLDRGFGTAGTVTTDFAGTSDNARALIQQVDGKLVVAGSTDDTVTGFSDLALARYNVDGTLDPGFGTGGLVTTDIATNINEARALVQLADGKLVVAGFAVGSNFDFALTRYNPDGTLDLSFGTGGTVTTDIARGEDFALALTVQADGRLVVAGDAETETGMDFALARYNPDGTLDPSFGTGGTVTTDISGGGDFLRALVVQADGKPTVAGTAGTDFALARYNSDGTLDPSFGTDGITTTDIAGGGDSANALAAQADGKLVAAGAAGPCCDFALARYRVR
jgi:uncharacterized delta-60 repeat protein